MTTRTHKTISFLILAFLVALSALPVCAQDSRKGKVMDHLGVRAAADVKILNVEKDNAARKRNPNGKGFIIPVKVKWQINLPEGAKAWDIKANLETVNTDKSVTKLEKALSVEQSIARNTVVERNDVLMLEMPDDVFAEGFVLRINSSCKFDEKGKERSVNSNPAHFKGRFPLPAEATKR